MSKTRISKRVVASIIEGGGSFLFLSGTCLFACQLFFWTLDGRWISFPLLFLFYMFGLKIPWLEDPKCYYELHSVVMFILTRLPLSFFVCLLGIIFLSWGEKVRGIQRR
ncbi:MAG: hypothetical protein COS99_07435 [Candidatus Omnitrophica bacterium CG07_land_8_20_14_0_80_42_15]|uniref:Uncharacterized protein n=1 Tax=Candidatus Aquitaenariimonas noxiae TaxID=1974741 RepID=A0A2J0KZB3_9BACT|nr:MAG: hypothetical protein COS99_07435 [Candidatus Omnitrophica bacterium CG07_land_8_20_14_0_80_42_15]